MNNKKRVVVIYLMWHRFTYQSTRLKVKVEKFYKKDNKIETFWKFTHKKKHKYSTWIIKESV